MGKIFSSEEQKQTLAKLESDVVATRFMTLKYVTFTALQDKLDYAKMDVELPDFTKTLVRTIDNIAKNDKVEMVKKEAITCIDALKKKLTPALMVDVPMCSSCGDKVLVTFKYCTKCGTDLKGQKWALNLKKCEKCQNPVDALWNNCPNCGNVLIQKVEVIRNCPACKKTTDPGWAMCPFCGTRLKLV